MMLVRASRVQRLPALPHAGEPISISDVERIETKTALALASIVDISEADEWRRKAKAIEAFLRSPELQRPMLGAQRRIEARIGQLLGVAKEGRPENSAHDRSNSVSLIAEDSRADFRLLARALDGECELSPDEWRKSRRALVSLIRRKLGLLPIVPPFPPGKSS